MPAAGKTLFDFVTSAAAETRARAVQRILTERAAEFLEALNEFFSS